MTLGFFPLVPCLVFATALACAQATAAEIPPSKIQGQNLAEQLRLQRPAEDSQARAILKIRSADGKKQEIPIRLTVLTGQQEWRKIFQAQPSSDGLIEQLTIVHRPDRAPEYWLSRAGSGQKPEKLQLEGDQTMSPFAQSDFWAADFGFEFLHWPDQRLVKNEMRRGRPSKVLESIDPNPKRTGYSRVRSWIDNETGGLLRAEAYDAKGRLLKLFVPGSFKKINGQWELKDMEIRNAQTDSRTRLEFELEGTAAGRSRPD